MSFLFGFSIDFVFMFSILSNVCCPNFSSNFVHNFLQNRKLLPHLDSFIEVLWSNSTLARLPCCPAPFIQHPQHKFIGSITADPTHRPFRKSNCHPCPAKTVDEFKCSQMALWSFIWSSRKMPAFSNVWPEIRWARRRPSPNCRSTVSGNLKMTRSWKR